MKVPSSRPPATPTVQALRSSLSGSEGEADLSDRCAFAAAGLPCLVSEDGVDLPSCGAPWEEHGCKDRPSRASPSRAAVVYLIAQPQCSSIVGFQRPWPTQEASRWPTDGMLRAGSSPRRSA